MVLDGNSDRLRASNSVLAERAFGGRALFAESFLRVSRHSYPLEWLVREVVQNFVDANTGKNKGTLNGVGVDFEELGGGKVRCVITGNWPFEDYTKLIELASGKADDLEAAGGNGIGIKQAALVLMRDFGVSVFYVDGQGWRVEYKMVSADDINAVLAGSDCDDVATEGCLMGNPSSLRNRGKCRYVFETSNPKVIDALRQFKNYGVCEDNVYLQAKPHFRCREGSLTWLPVSEPTTDEGKPVPQTGRLFVNGQISRYENQDGDFWGWLEGVSVQITSGTYRKNLDRTPVSGWELKGFAGELVETMSREDVIANLKASEHLWSRFNDFKMDPEPFCFRVVEAMVEKLSRWSFGHAEYSQHFGGKNYLALDRAVSDETKAALVGDGYVLCPNFFATIFMPKFSSRMSSVDRAAETKPRVPSAQDLFRRSTETSVAVPYKSFEWPRTFFDFGQLVRSELEAICPVRFECNDSEFSVRFFLDRANILPRHLVSMENNPSKNAYLANRLVHVVRGIADISVRMDKVKGFYLAQGDYVSTYDSSEGALYVKNTSASTDSSYVDISFRDEDTYRWFCKGLESFGLSRSTSVHGNRPKLLSPSLVKATSGFGIAALAAVGLYFYGQAPTGELGIDDLDVSSEAYKSVDSDVDGGVKRQGLMAILAQSGIDFAVAGSSVRPNIKQAALDFNDGIVVGAQKVLVSVVGIFDDYHSGATQRYIAASDYELVENPSPDELAQLRLLKEYFILTTGYDNFTDRFVLYEGDGIWGLNDGGIHLHRASLDLDFEEAVSLVTHEVAHDAPFHQTGDHGQLFQSVVVALDIVRENTLADIARIPLQDRKPWEERVLEIEAEWDGIQSRK